MAKEPKEKEVGQILSTAACRLALCACIHTYDGYRPTNNPLDLVRSRSDQPVASLPSRGLMGVGEGDPLRWSAVEMRM